MKPHVLLGLVLAAGLAAGIYFVPSFLRAPESVARRDAEQKAALAVRKLHHYDPVLPQLQPLVNLDALRQTSMPEIANLPGAVKGLDDLLKANDALLKQADADAGAGGALDAKAIGVKQAQGMAKLLEAVVALTTAERLRRDLETLDARLLALGAEWRIVQSYADRYKGFDVGAALDALGKDQEELKGQHAQATAEVEALTKQIADREQALAQATEGLKTTRTALQALETTGFQAGQDASFNAYRDQYARLAKQMQAYQEQEEEALFGGLKGGQVSDENPEGAPIQGGEPVVGLVALKARLAAAQDKVKRLEAAQTTLREHTTYVEAQQKTAQSEQGRYAQQLADLQAQMKKMMEEDIAQAAKNAFVKEQEALDAAMKAVDAFKAAETALSEWRSAAQTLQTEADAQRKNERLRAILDDVAVQQVPASAKAAAQTLVGRIHAQRIEALSAHVAVLQRFADVFPGSSIDVKPIQTAIDTAREGGKNALSDAVKTYGDIAQKLSGKTTVWVPKASQAAAAYLLSKVQAAGAADHLANARKLIQEAVERREQSPYLATLVRFRDHLKSLTAEEPAPESGGGGGEGQ